MTANAPISPIGLIVLQGVSTCNLDCSYCYLPRESRLAKGRINTDTVKQVFERILAYGNTGQKLQVLWHAGEPFVLPLSDYESLFAVIEPYAKELEKRGTILKHTLQSNGTLITKGHCDFVKENDIGLGISLDGPDFVHDRYRKNGSVAKNNLRQILLIFGGLFWD